MSQPYFQKYGIKDSARSLFAGSVYNDLIVGLVSQTREGTTLVCHTNYELMRGLVDYLVEECCVEGTCAPGMLSNKAA